MANDPRRRPPPTGVVVQRRRDPNALTQREREAWDPQPSGPAERDSVSGNTVIGVGARGTRPDPKWLEIIARGQWSRAEPRCLQLGTMPTPLPPEAQVFPAASSQLAPGGSYVAGQLYRDQLGNVQDGTLGYPVACVLEYGEGAAGHRVMFDWVPGSYNLPPCSYVSVAVLPWGALFASGWESQVFSAAVTRGNLEGAHVPTVTGRTAIQEGAYVEIDKPDQARAFDVEFAADASNVAPFGAVRVFGLASGVRDFGAGSYSPGWTPLEVSPIANLSGTNYVTVLCSDDGGNAEVPIRFRWYLSL